MNEIRYSLYTCAKYLGISAAGVKRRAFKLGINTADGLTATELKRVKECKDKRNKGSFDELKAEMEALG